VEKRTPHYDLANIQLVVARLGAAAFTKTAIDGGRNMGLTTAEMLAVIASLSRRQFYNSMTTYADIVFGRMCSTHQRRSGGKRT
jgi:motility quorum-sensing regulator / GCU-specific mRNA interferase toxin